MSAQPALQAPFPYYGGKRRASGLIWAALGDPNIYIEPFCGSAAVLLARPHKPKREVINDADGYVCNFWRALKAEPDQIAQLVDWPRNEIDLQARHRWLCEGKRKAEFLECMRADPEYYDVKIAAWWCWGISMWLGAGWCDGEWWDMHDERTRGACLHRSQQPHFSCEGVHAKRAQPLKAYMTAISNRLRHLLVLCGDWKRSVCTAILSGSDDIGIFLDPPYDYSADRTKSVYNKEMSCTDEVAGWCKAHQRDAGLRIVLAGYSGEYDLPGWREVEWKIRGGGHTRKDKKLANKGRERLWLSPNCEHAGLLW
ncbi:MAG: DNA adenine methylase [Methyloligellaceae bacterium]